MEKEYDLNLSAYGFFMWAIDHYGTKVLYPNMSGSTKAVEDYAFEAKKCRDDLPMMLINAADYVETVFGNIADAEMCFLRLSEMTYPYILFLVFAADDRTELVERFRPEIEEQLKRYPSTLDVLPEAYKKVGEEVLNADTE